MDCSPPGSSVHGILQERILEWVAMLSYRRSSPPRDRTCISFISCIGSGFCITSTTWGSLMDWCKYMFITKHSHRTSQVVLVVKNLPANAGDIRDTGSILGLGISPGGGHGNPLQYSFLENPMDWGTWLATVHRVTKSQTQQKWLSTHASLEYVIKTSIVIEQNTIISTSQREY